MAVVGCGDAAKTVVLASRFVRDVQLGAFVDKEISRARRMSRFDRKASLGSDWRVLLSDRSIDAVYVALPHGLHKEVALAFAGSGKSVLLEKPLAESAASGRELVDRLPAGAKVGVNYQYRYDRKVWALVEAARSGRLGEVHYVTVEVPWFRGPEYFDGAPWHRSIEAAGGGTLLTQGSHALDIALLCTGSVPKTACGRTYQRVHTDVEVEDFAAGVVETDSGTPVVITSSLISRPGFPVRIRVYGSRGAASYTGPGRPSLRGHGIRLQSPPVTTELQSYRLAVRAFARWSDGGEEFRCTAADALPVLNAVEAIYRSA